MISISQNIRYLPHDLNTKFYAVQSYRNDNERFYNTLKFYFLEDLRYQAKLCLKRSNNIPMAVLNYRTPNKQRIYLEQKN